MNKKEVGHRLALEAMDLVYHMGGPGTGPLYLSSQTKGDRVTIKFDHVGQGLTIRPGQSSLGGFAIAGADHQFVKADSEILGDTVVVHSDKVASPLAVRYLWANNPAASLLNKDGLPASPFRTDDWPTPTQEAR